MDRQFAINTIRYHATAGVLAEFEEYLAAIGYESDEGEPRDLVDAFIWHADGAEVNANSRKVILGVEIQLGLWRPILTERMDEQIAGGMNITRRDFPTFGGQRYECAVSLAEWEAKLVGEVWKN